MKVIGRNQHSNLHIARSGKTQIIKKGKHCAKNAMQQMKKVWISEERSQN
jgi:hypothetical protein